MTQGIDLTPWIPVIAAVLGGAIVGVFNLIRGRQGDTSSKGPTVEQVWSRLDRVDQKLETERGLRYFILRIFRAYVYRVQSGGSTDLTAEERRVIDQNPHETEQEKTS